MSDFITNIFLDKDSQESYEFDLGIDQPQSPRYLLSEIDPLSILGDFIPEQTEPMIELVKPMIEPVKPSTPTPAKITPKKIKKQSRKVSECKNIHRYITRQIIRALTSGNFPLETNILTSTHKIAFKKVKEYFESRIEHFTSLNMLREHWTVKPGDQSEMNKIKTVFKCFSKWFLKYRATRYILESGRMKDKEVYIKYKNRVMLYYVDHPEGYIKNQT